MKVLMSLLLTVFAMNALAGFDPPPPCLPRSLNMIRALDVSSQNKDRDFLVAAYEDEVYLPCGSSYTKDLRINALLNSNDIDLKNIYYVITYVDQYGASQSYRKELEDNSRPYSRPYLFFTLKEADESFFSGKTITLTIVANKNNVPVQSVFLISPVK